MRAGTLLSLAALALLLGFPANAQAPAAANGGDPGVNPVRMLDQAEVRVSRVEIKAGAVRSVHTHDDVRFHLWVPVSGKLEITIGSAKPVAAADGQAFFLKKGTPHGFKNVGTTTAVVMEIFVKEGASTASVAQAQTLAATFGSLPRPAPGD